MRETRPILTLVRHELEAQTPAAPHPPKTRSARAVPAVVGQPGLWQPAAPLRRDLAAALARVAALAGPGNVGSPRPDDTHRPDAFTLVPFAPPRGEPPAEAAVPETPLALRRVRPPLPIEVELADECPARLRWDRFAPRVVRAAGPWRVSGEWWDVGAWARDEWDVALADGTVCRVVRDRVSGRWYLDAVYD
jgi:protein ImuB